MKLRLRKAACLLLGVLLLTLVGALPTAAAEENEIEIPVEILTEGAVPAIKEVYVLRLTADEETFPMPNGQVGGYFDLPVTGAAKGLFPLISYSRVGIYTYKLEQIPGAHPDCAYDTRVYTVNVMVANKEGGGFETYLALHEEAETTKPDAAYFKNFYPWPPDQPGTGDHSDTVMWACFLGISLIGIVVVIILATKHKKKK